MKLAESLRTTSPVVAMIGLAMLLSSLISIYFRENPTPLILGSTGALLSSVLIWLSTKNRKTKNLGIQEGCAIVTFSWLLACLFGALPYFTMGIYDPALKISFTKSIFESVSGLTTTGASIFSDVESLPKGILFWRSFSQWIGGMGIVVLAIAILPKIGVGGMQAFKMETPGPLKNDKLMPRISQTAKILYRVYFTLSIALFVILTALGIEWFDAIIHTFSTIATGGFSNYNNSVAGLQNIGAEYAISLFMWLGGINFSLVYFVIWKRRAKLAIQNTEFKTYAAIHALAVIAVTFYLYINHLNGANLDQAFRYGLFQVTSIMTTSGFSTTDYNLWPSFPISILLFLMFIGGSTGSTSGSLKVLRHIITFKFIKWELLKIAKPNLITSIKIGTRAIHRPIINSVIVLLTIFTITFGVGTVLLTYFDLSLSTAASVSIASIAGIGPALYEFGPASNYSNLHQTAQWIVIFLMFIGRLEIMTILVLFLPTVWLKK